MTHADKVAAARDAVVEAAKQEQAIAEAAGLDVDEFVRRGGRDWMDKRIAAVTDLLALEAATCATCGGTGFHPTIFEYNTSTGVSVRQHNCPANCDAGRDARRERGKP